MTRMKHCVEFFNNVSFINSVLKSSRNNNEPLPVIYTYIKDFYTCQNSEFVIRTLQYIEPYKNLVDGVIFTNNEYPYYPFRNQGIIKWKPDYMNTIDFLVTHTPKMEKEFTSFCKDYGIE